MVGIYSSIHAGLDAQLLTVATLPAFTAENAATFKPVLGVPFSRSTLLPVQPMMGELGAGGRTMFQGLYQIDLFYPANAGADIAEKMVDLVLGAFARGTSISQDDINIRVRLAYRMVARAEPPWFVVPVSVSWWSLIAN